MTVTTKETTEKDPYKTNGSNNNNDGVNNASSPTEEAEIIVSATAVPVEDYEITVPALVTEEPEIAVTAVEVTPSPLAPVTPVFDPTNTSDVVVPTSPSSKTETTVVTQAPTPTVTTTATLVSGYGAPLIPSVSAKYEKTHQLRVTVKHNLWMDSFAETICATDTETGKPFPLRMVSQFQGKCTQVLLLDASEQERKPIAVLRKNDLKNPDKFHLFGMAPLVPNQSRSISMTYKDQPMYTWGSLSSADGLITYSSKSKFHFHLQNGYEITAKNTSGGGGGLFGIGKKRADDPQKYEISIHTHNVQVGQRNVNINKGPSITNSVTMGQNSDLDWKVSVTQCPQNNLDPVLFIILALFLDEMSGARL